MLCMTFYTLDVKLPYPQYENVTQRTPDRLTPVFILLYLCNLSFVVIISGFYLCVLFAPCPTRCTISAVIRICGTLGMASGMTLVAVKAWCCWRHYPHSPRLLCCPLCNTRLSLHRNVYRKTFLAPLYRHVPTRCLR